MNVTPITPMTELRVLRGVALNPSYTDTMTFANADAQKNYFIAKSKYTWNNLVPVRDNTIRIPIPVDNIYDCGYCMYKNGNFNNKWFYAFIREKKWVNANCCEIILETDVIMTWIFEWSISPSYVVRQHVINDLIGTNITPEPNITTALKIKATVDKTNLGIDSGVGAIIWYMPRDGQIPGTSDDRFSSGNVFAACNRVYYPKEHWGKMYTDIIEPLASDGLLDNIIAIQMVPSVFQEQPTGSLTENTYYIQHRVSSSKFKNLDGYVPANNKLLTFPYNSLIVASGDGEQNEYTIENFQYGEDDMMTFQIYCTLSIAPVVVCQPLFYGKNAISNKNITPSNISTSKNFPLGFYSGLSGLAYIQNLVTGMMNTTRDFAVTEMSHPLDQAIGRGIGLLSESMELPFIGGVSAQGTRQGGQLPTSTTLYNMCFSDFYFEHSCITNQNARWADKMLTRWGYQINSVQTVHINGRERFNYVQTKDLLITGANIPPSDLDKIKRVFEGGVTLWHNERGHEIGDWDGDANSNPIV